MRENSYCAVRWIFQCGGGSFDCMSRRYCTSMCVPCVEHELTRHHARYSASSISRMLRNCSKSRSGRTRWNRGPARCAVRVVVSTLVHRNLEISCFCQPQHCRTRKTRACRCRTSTSNAGL